METLLVGRGAVANNRHRRLKLGASSPIRRSHRQSRSATTGHGQVSSAGADDRKSITRNNDGGGDDSSHNSSSDNSDRKPSGSVRDGAAGGRGPPSRGDKESSSSCAGHRRSRRWSRSRSGDRRSRSASRRRRRNWIRPSCYDGTTNVETFLAKFEEAAKHNDWNVDDKLAHLYCTLVGPAEDLLCSTRPPTRS